MADGSLTTSNGRICAIVRTLLTKRDFRGPLDVTQPLHEAGLTSLDMVNLMLAVEAEFDLEIPQAQMTPENFRSVAAIERLVDRLALAA
ncbi:MAG: phosphopantetheine-binding protein [Caulobacteraceae bacterium]|nr:phosphopantetheine-binding protein [Caulobacteraceae bacterium]